MTSPLLDENYIMQHLDPRTKVTAYALRRSIQAVVLTAFDRKVKRDAFADLMDKAGEAWRFVALAEAAAVVKKAFVDDERTSPVLDEGVLCLEKNLVRVRCDLMEHLSLLMECAETEERIN
jgi:hypothetical protein